MTAGLNSNNWYLTIDGTDVSEWVVDLTLSPSIASQDITAGANSTDIARGEGLRDHSLDFTLAYTRSAQATILPLVEVGTHTFIIGIDGNTAGRPKHQQSMIIEGNPISMNVTKELMAFSISAVGAAAPVYNFASDTF